MMNEDDTRTRTRVFVSSTLGELASEREAAKSAITSLRMIPVGLDLGGHANGDDQTPRSADLFVGIYWQANGWVSGESELSSLEADLEASAGLPRLIYVKEPSPEREPGLARLIDGFAAEGTRIRPFETAGDLAEMLIDDLARESATRPGRMVPEDLPRGTLTFMFGEIEGSTPILQRLGARYHEVLTAYHQVVADRTGEAGGTVVDLEGERVFSVFPDAFAAVNAAVGIQRDLDAHHWPDDVEVRSGIGLHTGTAQIGSGGYVGLDVHRASRVTSAAHGGQILVSAPVRELVLVLAEGQGMNIHDLGTYSLRGLSRAERLYQVQAPGLVGEFPPPRARSTTRVRLPVPQSSLIGREVELAEIVDQLQRPEIHLLTLTGPAGIGKTRLAIAAAEALVPDFPDGVYFVNLAPVTEARQVPLAIGEAAGVPIEGDPIDALIGEFADQQVLLVVDNFEHVVEAGTAIGSLLARSPGLKVMATSRVPLRLMTEHELALEPLAVPAPEADRADSLSTSDAVKLFLDRATSVIPGFSINEDNARPVASIVRTVEGLPLAIELAAARLRMLSPRALCERLMGSFDALGGGPADVPSRQKTLEAAIDWSYQLLTREERELFMRLCVFSGGFTVESAQEVAVEEGDAVDQLMSLVENSLVLPAQGGDGRLRMLGPIREFGLRRLHESGDYEWIKDRHAAYYVRTAVAAFAELRGIGQPRWVETLNADWNNIDLAAEWLAGRDDKGLVELSYGLWVYIWVANHLRDAVRWIEGVADPESLDEVSAGHYWWLRGGLDYEMGRYDESRVEVTRALEIVESSGDVDCHNWSDFVSILLEPAFGIDSDHTRGGLEKCLARFRGFGDRWGEGYALLGLAILAAGNGELGLAERYQLETRQLGVDLANPAIIGLADANLGFGYVAAGRTTEAREALIRSFETFRSMNYREGLCYALEAAASLSFAEGRADLGMVALGAAEEIRERIGLQPWPLIRWLFDSLSAMADSLDDPALQGARHNGRQMNPFDAAALVLETGLVVA